MLQRKIAEKAARIGVVGLGYVGLPLALLCGQKGFRVTGIDSNQSRVISLQQGKSFITGVSEEVLRSLLAQGRLWVTGNFATVSRCDVIFVCVPTPLTADAKPDYTHLFLAVESIAAGLRRQQIVIIESTITPGTTMEKILPRLEGGGLKVGQDFFLAFSPERIDPANKAYSLGNTPKLVAGVTPDCQRVCQEIYTQLGIKVVPVSTPTVAEMAKLLENTYRDVNIALVNEMAEVCHCIGIDIWEVIKAAATKPFGFHPFYPGLGVGGHCIPKDSAYYIYLARRKGRPALLAEQARKINADRPVKIMKRLQTILVEQGKALADCQFLFLGVTYKKDVNDLRESPTVKVMELLVLEGAEVSFHDPYIKKLRIGNRLLARIKLDEGAFARYTCIVLTVPHSCYDVHWLKAVCPQIVDLTNVLAN